MTPEGREAPLQRLCSRRSAVIYNYGEEIRQLVKTKLVNSNAFSYSTHNAIGEELHPIQAENPSAVFYSATVVGEEALGEDIQQLLQPSVLQCTVQSAIPSHILHPHTFSMSKRRRRR